MRNALALLISLSMPAVCHAVPIVFTHQGVGRGTVGNTFFDNAAFTITALADTTDRQPFQHGYFINHASASIDINGVGFFSFLTPTRTFNNSDVTQTVGFSRAGSFGSDLLNGPTNAVFASWDMTSPIGPLSGPGLLLQWDDPIVQTSGGQLRFETQRDAPVTFNAHVLPEPSASVLTILAFSILGCRPPASPGGRGGGLDEQPPLNKDRP